MTQKIPNGDRFPFVAIIFDGVLAQMLVDGIVELNQASIDEMHHSHRRHRFETRIVGRRRFGQRRIVIAPQLSDQLWNIELTPALSVFADAESTCLGDHNMTDCR